MSCKEPGRDYATTAFIQYAALGRPTRNQQEEKIKSEIHQRLAFEEPGFIVVRAAAALTEREGLLSDIDAVNRVISTLQREGKGYIVDAIEAVYFPYAGYKHARGAITARVRRFALDYPANEATVYRWLKTARLLFCRERGLSVSSDYQNKGCK
mgnify:FL=1